MNKVQTTEILTKFYAECEAFWIREGKEIKEAKNLALQDIERLTTNPYSPQGKELDKEAQRAVIETLKAIL